MATKIDIAKCELCEKSSTIVRYTKVQSLESDAITWVNSIQQKTLRKDDIICRGCAMFINRNVGKQCLPKRWTAKKETKKDKCIVDECTNTGITNTKITSRENAAIILGSLTIQTEQLILCNKHYQILYQVINQAEPCACCNASPKHGKGAFIRRSPNPKHISLFLQRELGFENACTLTEESRICKHCYDFHRHILQAAESTLTLADIRLSLENKLKEIHVHNAMSLADFLEWNVLLTSVGLCKHFENDKAIFLPDLYKDFTSTVQSNLQQTPSLVKESMPTSRWLLSCISYHFNDTLGMICKHKRYGTMLYYKKTDILKILSKTMGEAKENIRRKDEIQKDYIELCNRHMQPEKIDASSESQLETVCLYLNHCLHKQAADLIDQYSKDPNMCADFDMHTFALSINPTLLSCLNLLTKTKSGSVCTDALSKARLVKNLFIMSVLLFMVNKQCYMPLPFLLTTASSSFGASAQLIKIMNHLGVGVSEDTYARISTYIAKQRLLRGIRFELQPNTLNIVSIDNIDILLPHSMVSSMQSHRSWHGTSVQCVQPKPSFKTACLSEISRKRECSSPAASPVVKQLRKRARTLTECVGTKHVTLELPSLNVTSSSYHLPQRTPLSISHFKILPAENEKMNKVRKLLITYSILRDHLPINSNFPDMVQFTARALYSSAATEISNVVYLDVISLPADSKETVLSILKQLHFTFIVEEGLKWLIIVGDAKTYDILLKIRDEYGHLLNWMIPFPGDWHILFNYQKVIMKIYADAGLNCWA